MLNDILEQSQKQAERSSPSVRAAARMRIARVQSATDSEHARITFEMAFDEIHAAYVLVPSGANVQLGVTEARFFATT